MRFFLFIFFSLLSLAQATDEVLSPRVRVLYSEPRLALYAQDLAAAAERALDILAPYFGEPARPITINLRDDTDLFNAFATPLPRPNAALWALFPNAGAVGLRAEDPLFLVALHELTHNLQLSYTERLGGAPLRFGLVGQNVARVTPPWFTEGLATWFESEHTAGGRRDAALTKGILETLALADAWPTLTEVSLGNYSAWPGGNTRYLLGVGFVDYLVKNHGLETILELLQTYNSGSFLGTFSSAWQRAVGTDLAAEWDSWQAKVLAAAQARTKTLEEAATLTETGWFTGAASLSPDGDRLAYLTWPPAIAVADLSEDGLGEERTFADKFPETLAWLDDNTLLYNRTVRQPGSRYLDLFTLDLTTGEEIRLTRGARAHFPTPLPSGCILYVRDVVPEGSSLQQWCDGETSPFWTSPSDGHITDLAVSEAGQVALSIWRAGFVDIALLENGELTFLTQDAAVDKDLTWQGETTLFFSSDRADTGLFEIYSLELGAGELTQNTESEGGAFEPLVCDKTLIFTSLGAKGYDLGKRKLGEGEPVDLTRGSPPESLTTEPDLFEVRNYSPLPSLVPYGWLPLDFSAGITPIRLGAAASVLGQDDSGEHIYALSFGYDTGLGGPLAGFYSDIQYRYLANELLGNLVAPEPLSFGVRAGLWPHNPHLLPLTETALGFSVSLASTLTLDRWVARGALDLGLIYLNSAERLQPDVRGAVSLSQQRSDDWSYPTGGPRFGVTGVLSATPEGSSLGAWANATYYSSLPVFGLGGTAELGLRAGYRQSPPVPLSLQEYAAVGSAGYRVSFAIEWRYSDGLYALERVTLEPRARSWFDGAFGLGGDLSFNIDTLINYQAPVSFGVSLGYAQGLWYRFGLRLAL